jgi:hypothetical protein
LEREIKEWKKFANAAFLAIRKQARFTGDFPANDGPVQRFILCDLLQKVSVKSRSKAIASFEYQNLLDKYRDAKGKLREVNRRCNVMLSAVGDQNLCYPPYHSSRRRFSAYRDLGADLRSLTELTSGMRCQYQAHTTGFSSDDESDV